MSKRLTLRHWTIRIGQGLILPGLALGCYLLYRWAEPSPETMAALEGTEKAAVTIRVENAPFTGYAQGRKTWALWAERIDLERPPGAALTNLQSATLIGIRDGKLFDAEPNAPPLSSTTIDATPTTGPRASSSASDPKLAATFRAGRGRYTPGQQETPPADFSPANYVLQWQLKMMDAVDFRTKNGDRLQAEALTVVELMNRRTGRKERRILAETGVTVTGKNFTIRANRARYDPESRIVECLGGVRGTFPNGTAQAERAFWSLKEQTAHFPETTTGTARGMAFTTTDLVIDLKRRTLSARRAQATVRTNPDFEIGVGARGFP